jgi:SPX domain protein involved in polyphosphate accumulation
VVLEAYHENYSELNKGEHLVYDKLRSIFAQHLFASPLMVIDLEELIADLTSLSALLRTLSTKEEIKLHKESMFSMSEDTEKKGSSDAIDALIRKKD